MNLNNKVYDILLVEGSTAIIDLFSVLTKKFDLTIKFVKNTNEFTNITQRLSFKFVICDINLDYKYEGLFIARVYNNIKKIKNNEGKILLMCPESPSENELKKLTLDGILPRGFSTIYDFLLQNFPLRSYQDLLKNEERYIISSLG